jgi:hypothetical protein
MLRIAVGLVVAVLVSGALPDAAAAQGTFAGTWHGVAAVNGMSCSFDRVITPAGTYSEIERCGSLATSQSGIYKVFPNQTIAFAVTDWTPKQRYVLTSGYSGHYEANAKPAGGTFRYTFTNPNTLVFRDVNLGGTLTYRRVR